MVALGCADGVTKWRACSWSQRRVTSSPLVSDFLPLPFRLSRCFFLLFYLFAWEWKVLSSREIRCYVACGLVFPVSVHLCSHRSRFLYCVVCLLYSEAIFVLVSPPLAVFLTASPDLWLTACRGLDLTPESMTWKPSGKHSEWEAVRSRGLCAARGVEACGWRVHH